MRALPLLMVALVVALLAAVGLFILRPEQWNPQQWFPRGTSATPSAAAGQPDSAHQAGEPRHRKPPDRRKPDSRVKPDAIVLESSGPASVPLIRAEISHRFPRAEQVVRGAAKSVILATFGPPTATVTGSDLGRLQERFVYLDEASGTKTQVFFVNGNVTGADTSKE